MFAADDDVGAAIEALRAEVRQCRDELDRCVSESLAAAAGATDPAIIRRKIAQRNRATRLAMRLDAMEERLAMLERHHRGRLQ